MASETVFSEDDLRVLRSLGDSKGGQVLVRYLEYEKEGYMNGLLRCPAEDAPSVAHGQAGAELSKKLLGLLQQDIRQILEQHNIEERKDE